MKILRLCKRNRGRAHRVHVVLGFGCPLGARSAGEDVDMLVPECRAGSRWHYFSETVKGIVKNYIFGTPPLGVTLADCLVRNIVPGVGANQRPGAGPQIIAQRPRMILGSDGGERLVHPAILIAAGSCSMRDLSLRLALAGLFLFAFVYSAQQSREAALAVKILHATCFGTGMADSEMATAPCARGLLPFES